jgi:hypothetical protein
MWEEKVKAVLVLSQFKGSVVRWYERYPTILPTNPRNPRRQQAFRTLRGEYFVYAVELWDIGHVSTEHMRYEYISTYFTQLLTLREKSHVKNSV